MFKFIGFHSYPLTHMCLTKVFNVIATFCSASPVNVSWAMQWTWVLFWERHSWSRFIQSIWWLDDKAVILGQDWKCRLWSFSSEFKLFLIFLIGGDKNAFIRLMGTYHVVQDALICTSKYATSGIGCHYAAEYAIVYFLLSGCYCLS